MDPFDVSLIIACYNEGPIFQQGVRQIIEILDVTRWSYELIFIDDCSQDSTPETIRRIVATNRADAPCARRNVRAVFHTENVGRGGTVSEGIRLARGTVVGFIDIDLEVRAYYVPVFVLAIMQGADMAMAERGYRITPRIMHRWVLSRGYNKLLRFMLKLPYNDTEAGYKFFNRRAILPILAQTQHVGWFWDTEIVARAHMAGLKVLEIPVLFEKRPEKKSTVRLLPDMRDYWLSLWRFRAQIQREITKQTARQVAGYEK